METKLCCDCQVEQDLENFSPHSRGKFGRYSYCKECAKRRTRAFHAQHPASASDYRARMEQRHPEYRKRKLDYLANRFAGL